ncbi:MAG: DUF4397 domain-containing protein [Candidatus Cybelea sp.]
MNCFSSLTCLLFGAALAGCGGSGSSSNGMPAQAGTARVRYADGAPSLEALINGVPQDIGVAYLQVDSHTVVSIFSYGTITSFFNVTPGVHSVTARDTLGYAVGPLKTPSLSAGKLYSLILVGSYPNYRVLAFEEPASSGNAQLSLYEASPSSRHAEFGTFQASTSSNFKQLGNASFGNVATVNLGKSVSNIGGYVGPPNPRATMTPKQIDSFDAQNVLPFQNASRLSLFLFDPKAGSGRVFGSLDR